MKIISIFIFVCVILQGCHSDKRSTANGQDILLANLDTIIHPGDDFFEYANGGWLKRNPIPPAYSSWGIANLVIEDLYSRLKKINEEALNKPNGLISQKIAGFWQSGMDSIGRVKSNINLLSPQLALIDSVHDINSLFYAASQLDKIGVGTIFSSNISQDEKNSDSVMFHLWQGGIGLPDRDYYFNKDKRTTDIRTAYLSHIQKIFMLSGMDSNTAGLQSEQIFTLEKSLAGFSRKLADLRDPYANYTKLSLAKLAMLTPDIDWQLWFKTNGVVHIDSVIVGQPEFFTSLNKIVKSVPIETWKMYLKWHLYNELGSFIGNDFEQENFKFWDLTMNGVKTQKPLWKRVLISEEGAMGEALGQLFVKENFDSTAKKRYSDLVENIRSALKERIQKLDWMSPVTKQKALYKLSRMKKKVGYPDKWKDFSAMDIKKQPYVLNIIAANIWWHNYNLAKLGKPVDRDEWDMTPQTYNAYYNPSNNEIVLPAGIFTVPGKKDAELDNALVYGYAGASTIGHEMTHGFDDQGRQFDANGNLSDWWTKEDGIQFKKRAQIMVDQFNSYIPVDTSHINGAATLGENIADLGGVLLGWDAFSKTNDFKENKQTGNLTARKRFFLGYALGWLYHIRPEALARQLLTDVHAPAKYRVNGPFADVDAFYQTFSVKPGDKMYIADSSRVRIW